MNKTFLVITDKRETPFVLEEAAHAEAQAMVKLGIKVTILCNGNIIWVG